jgi:phosphoserine phosphatase
MRKERILVFDWDKTLSPWYMPKAVIDALAPESEIAYWKGVNSPKSPVKTPELNYLWAFSKQVREGYYKGPVNISVLEELGQTLPMWPGAMEFLGQMWAQGIQVHIVTTGLTHFLAKHPVRRYITGIQGCSYADEGLQTISELVTAADKARCLYDISNGDLSKVVYIGDGGSDFWAMKAAIDGGGVAAGVWDPTLPKSIDQVIRLQAELGLHFMAEADYREGSGLNQWLKRILSQGSKYEHVI